MSAQTGFGGPRPKREVIDVLEPKKPDKRLDKLITVRKSRLDRFEREKTQAREAWRESRKKLRKMKQDWRGAVVEADDFWREARAQFLRMTMTSGEIRVAKSVYEKMKSSAAQMRLNCREEVTVCKKACHAFFEALRQVKRANCEQEKLSILRDEIRLAARRSED